MAETSRLIKMGIRNIGCIGPEGCEIALDSILCLVGGNNSGKSTVLRAYELAFGTAVFRADTDLCRRAGDSPATVEIWAHIPEGTENIAEKWKIHEGNLRLVRSKWEWSSGNNWSKVRSTWNPEIGDYSTDDKASGLDSVFTSRLPVPLRIGSLDDPDVEHKNLLKLVLQPISEKLKQQMSDAKSDLRQAIGSVSTLAQGPVSEEKQKLKGLTADLNKSHNAIFPDLKMDFDIGIGAVEIDPLSMLLRNSKLMFTDWKDEVSWEQQGTGSQRALFWTILQVRSKLKQISDMEEQKRKTLADIQRLINKRHAEAEAAAKAETKAKKYAEIEELKKQHQALVDQAGESSTTPESTTGSFPGFMLLIDEPEIALHPNAIRAASQYLYSLADDKSWQVILTTHSPLFIDPLHDHTTIVRLSRTDANPTPRTYQSDAVEFSKVERENLKILNRFDPGLAEMFFGQFPIIIEGDTEYSAFEKLISKYPEKFPISDRPVLVRARGKFTILLLIKILSQFKVPFALLHDADEPFRRDGAKNAAWSANLDIFKAVKEARGLGIRVVHRISMPVFEHAHTKIQVDDEGRVIDVSTRDKPWNIIDKMSKDEKIESSILALLTELISKDAKENLYGDEFEKALVSEMSAWAQANCPKDSRYKIP